VAIRIASIVLIGHFVGAGLNSVSSHVVVTELNPLIGLRARPS
jgi:hypothetical protein